MTDGSPTPVGVRAWHLAFWPTFIVAGTLAMSALHVLAANLYPDPVYWIGSRYDMVTTNLDRIASLTLPAHRQGLAGDDDSVVYLAGSG